MHNLKSKTDRGSISSIFIPSHFLGKMKSMSWVFFPPCPANIHKLHHSSETQQPCQLHEHRSFLEVRLQIVIIFNLPKYVSTLVMFLFSGVHNRPFSKDKQSRFKVIPFFVSFYDCLLQDLLHLHLVLEPLTQTFNLLLLNVSIPKYRAAVMCWTIWKLLSDCNPKPLKVYLSHRYWPNRTRQRLFPLFSFLLFFLR